MGHRQATRYSAGDDKRPAMTGYSPGPDGTAAPSAAAKLRPSPGPAARPAAAAPASAAPASASAATNIQRNYST